MPVAEFLALQAKGGKRRGAKAPVEDPIQAAIVAALRLALPADAVVACIPNEQRGKDQAEAARRAGRLKKLGVFAGFPDLLVIHESRLIFLEVKGPDGRLSDRQEEFRDRVVPWGWPWAVVRDVDGAIRAVKAAGFPCRAS